jgi:hypothetical protein
MDKLELAKYLLEEVGMPPKQQSTLCCLALLAMAKLTKDTPCRQASNDWIRIHDIIAFIGEHYGVIYAENSRETFRKQAMHAFRTALLNNSFKGVLSVRNRPTFFEIVCSD